MTLAAGFTYGFAVLWDVMNGSELDRFGENHGVDVHSAVFSPDGERLVTTGGDCAALIWEIRTRRLVQSLDCRRGRWVPSDRTPVAFSPDGRFLFGGCCDKRVRMWELPD
jgi:WD40 repeat protein